MPSPEWDADSPRSRKNLKIVFRRLIESAKAREDPTLKMPRSWHSEMMRGLEVPDEKYVGNYRGEPGLEGVEVAIELLGGPRLYGVPSDEIEQELAGFIASLNKRVAKLDRQIPPGQSLSDISVDDLHDILCACAWAHAEWVRIHPFANGNGRSARLWANWLAIRYGLPGFVSLRPRPSGLYGYAASQAMLGEWIPTVAVMHELLRENLRRYES
ncbi:MAG TPA: Fic family protein [Gammaproteobacteria bacterium]|nr:Fic family protein [Gammaproteobacteria bacterium]